VVAVAIRALVGQKVTGLEILALAPILGGVVLIQAGKRGALPAARAPRSATWTEKNTSTTQAEAKYPLIALTFCTCLQLVPLTEFAKRINSLGNPK
jgi:hypothetical protein